VRPWRPHVKGGCKVCSANRSHLPTACCCCLLCAERCQKLLASWVPLHAVLLHTISARLEQAALGNERPDLSESNAVPPQGRPQEQ